MKWVKLGRIFTVPRDKSWMKFHASVPFAENIGGDLFRIYFSSRNRQNESSIGYIVINLYDPSTILKVSEQPLLSKGDIGTFDDSGVMGSCIVEVNNRKYLYYIGWNLGVTVPFRNAIGLAESTDGGATFHRKFKGPILDRTKDEPYFTASSCVIFEDGIYKIWYLSCTKWEKKTGKHQHYYHIKYAESKDGINWDRKGVVAIDFKDTNEYAISVPRVIKELNVYKMWYSFRGEAYRIGYAESKDGVNWIRYDDKVGIDVSEIGWDSEMICYPFVFDHKGERYMLYNGNGYGKTGFGLARLEENG